MSKYIVIPSLKILIPRFEMAIPSLNMVIPSLKMVIPSPKTVIPRKRVTAFKCSWVSVDKYIRVLSAIHFLKYSVCLRLVSPDVLDGLDLGPRFSRDPVFFTWRPEEAISERFEGTVQQQVLLAQSIENH